MNAARVREVADAVLYEGYMLYPYRPSATKNRQRWTFGGLCPRAYSEATRGSEPWQIQAECLAQGDGHTLLAVQTRFLHLQTREAGALASPLGKMPDLGEPVYTVVPELQIGERSYRPWEEAVEREVHVPQTSLAELLTCPQRLPIAFPAWRGVEPLRDRDGMVAGVLVRQQQEIAGVVALGAEQVQDGVFKLCARVENLTPCPQAASLSRDAALLQAFASTHLILALDGGEFVSQTDPPDALRDQVASCRNVGVWPVLVGDESERDAMLASPIILYDYPQIAPESPGALFDGAEIDEILTLRIMTLTDEEKRELRGVDDRTRALLDRTEALPEEALARLHGAMRSLRPSGEMRA